MGKNIIIVTRHSGLVEWLSRNGITGTVVGHATEETVAGKRVYGILPLHLSAHATEVWTVDMPDLPADRRGTEMTPEEMDSFGATLVGYRVQKI